MLLFLHIPEVIKRAIQHLLECHADSGNEETVAMHKYILWKAFILLQILTNISRPFQTPAINEEWRKVAEDFHRKWNFPHCIGAVDGKHINIVPPANNGSYFFNYKGTHSIVLMAVANAKYVFIYVDIGCNCRASDGGVWGNCTLSSAFEENNRIGVPDADTLPNFERILPYCLIGDDEFPLKTYLLNPYPFRSQQRSERIFSYRLSRARRVVENAFGILSNRFRYSSLLLISHQSRSKKLCWHR